MSDTQKAVADYLEAEKITFAARYMGEKYGIIIGNAMLGAFLLQQVKTAWRRITSPD